MAQNKLRSKTLASLKPEISQALDSFLGEIRSTADKRPLHHGVEVQTATASRFAQAFSPAIGSYQATKVLFTL